MAALSASTVQRLRAAGLATGGLGALGLAIGLRIEPTQTWLSYLAAYAYAISIAVGALFVLLIGRAVNASWVAPLRRLAQLVGLAVVPLSLFFVPLLFGLEQLYPWVQPSNSISSHLRELLEHKATYLNVPFFLSRALIYFLVWGATALVLWRGSIANDEHPPLDDLDPEAITSRQRAISSVALVPNAIVLTLASIDWLMSLQPAWFSTMFGVYCFAGSILAACALLTVLAARAQTTLLSAYISEHHFHVLGRLMLTFVIFWTYCAYFQGFLIAIADKPAEVSFYLRRTHHGWSWLTQLLLFGHFALPFALLLPRATKFDPRYMSAVAVWLLLMHFADMYWLVVPSHADFGGTGPWLALAALAFVAGPSLAFVTSLHGARPVVATGDAWLPRGIRYRSGT